MACLHAALAESPRLPTYHPREGDLVFQSLPHCPLVDVIEGCTHSPFSHCGIMHKGESGWMVIEAIGPRMARALFATAEGFDGAYAEKIGLVQYTVEDEAGLTSMMEQLSELALAAAPGAVADSKALTRHVAAHAIDDHLLKETARRIAKRRASSEGREGLKAFLEKRKPEWNS